MVSEYRLKFVMDLDVSIGDLELSGGTFDPRTCNFISFGDHGMMHEVSIVKDTLRLVRAGPVIVRSLLSSVYGSVPDSKAAN